MNDNQFQSMKSALRKSEDMFRVLTETAQDAIFFKDTGYRYTFVNPAVERILGLPASQVIGRTPEELYDPETAAIVREVDRVAMEGGIFNDIKTIAINGRPMTFHTIQVPVRGEDGEISGICCIVRDITEFRAAEEECREVEQKLANSSRLESLGNLAGGVAHDFNNILGIILGNADLAEIEVAAGNNPSDQLQEIRVVCRRARDLIRQILDFSTQRKIKTRVFNLGVLVEDVSRLVRAGIPAGIKLVKNIPDRLFNVTGDETMINQVILNLMTNAAHAIGQEGTMTISVSNSSGPGDEEAAASGDDSRWVSLIVSDDGAGILPEHVSRVFEPYFTTKKGGEGSGMGLAVSYGIVKAHGGSITVKSTPGTETSFEVLLPAARDESDDIVLPKPESRPCHRGSGKVILVDDEEQMARMVGKQLENLGFEALVFTDPREALKCFEADPRGFDMVISDLSMPGMSGEDLAANVLSRRPEIPVIICTGFGGRVDGARIEEIGVRALLNKPMTMDELAEAIEGALKPRRKEFTAP